MKKYYEDFEIGEKACSISRVITSSDVVQFSECSQNIHPIHCDEEYCQRNPLVKKCVVHGVFVLGIADGMMAREILPDECFLIHYGSDSVRYIKPVYHGDAVHIETEVAEKREKNEEYGLIYFNINVINQNGEIVIFYRDIQMIQKKGPIY